MSPKCPFYIALVVAAVAIGIQLATIHYGFGGYDLGLLYNLQNLLVNGASFRDIPLTMPLAYVGLVGLGARIFGNTYAAPFLMATSLYLGFVVGGLWLHTSRRGDQVRTIRFQIMAPLFVVCMSVNLLNPGHLWHSDLTSMLAVAILFTEAIAVQVERDRILLIAAILAGLMPFMKPNTALLYEIGLLAYYCLRIRAHKFNLLIMLLSTLGWGVVLVSALPGFELVGYLSTMQDIARQRGSPTADPSNYKMFFPPEFLQDGPLGRFRPRPMFLLGLYTACVLIPLGLLADALMRAARWRLRAPRPARCEGQDHSEDRRAIIVLCIFFVIGSNLGLASNIDLKSADLSVTMFSLSLLVLFLGDAMQGLEAPSLRALTLSSALLLLLSCLSAVAKVRMTLVGPPAVRDSWTQNRLCRLAKSAFWGDGFRSSLQHCLVDEAVRSRLKTLAEEKVQRLFFGPRMEVYYAATRSPSPVNLPIWWHPGSSYSISKGSLYANIFRQNDYQALIFLGGDFTGMPRGILNLVTHSGLYVSCPGRGLGLFLSRRWLAGHPDLLSRLDCPSLHQVSAMQAGRLSQRPDVPSFGQGGWRGVNLLRGGNVMAGQGGPPLAQTAAWGHF